MNICFVCKYPPIQGGVSMHCYWAARGLAERGHQVFVITNADEVEETFRIRIPATDRLAGGMYAPAFADSGGKAVVFSTSPPDRGSLYYIPMGNPTVTRLATMAADVIREHRCEVIFSYYFEPYGVAAHLASIWTGVPYVFKHAGSDLNRLMPISDLTTAYREVLLRANRVLSGGMSRKLISSHGVAEDRIDSSVGFGLPTICFNPDAMALDLDALLRESRSGRADDGESDCYLRPLRHDLPVLGIYGKMGEYKGSFDLIRAVGRLNRDGFAIQLVALSHGWQEQTFHSLAEDLGVQDLVRVLPFIPHWQIPNFISACDAVAFLEREFPIAAHTPTIPTEILSCGACLIISEEVLRKQIFRWKARHHQNLIVVSDPRNVDELAAALRFALCNLDRARAIGRAGWQLVEDVPSYSNYIDGLERVLVAVAGEQLAVPMASADVDAGSMSLMDERHDPLDLIERRYPYVYALLNDQLRTALRASFQGAGVGSDVDNATALALAIGERMQGVLEATEDAGLICDVCRYEYKLHQWCKRRDAPVDSPTSRTGAFPQDPGKHVPRIRGEWEIQEFSFDVERLAISVTNGQGRIDSDLALKSPLYVLFHEGGLPKRVDAATAALLLMLEGNCLPTQELVSRLRALFGSSAAGRLEESIHSVLEALYWDGALVFERNSAEAIDRATEH